MEAKESISDIGVSISALNFVNCSLPNGIDDCLMLNRSSCRRTPMTCGECLIGFIGENGDANTPCIDSSNILMNPIQYNDILLLPKQCPGNCSADQNRGQCIYKSTTFDSSKGKGVFNSILDSCTIGQQCNAICVCDTLYTGEACHLNKDEVPLRIQIRNDLFNISSAIDDVFSDYTDVDLNRMILLVNILISRSDELDQIRVEMILNQMKFILNKLESSSTSRSNSESGVQLIVLYENLNYLMKSLSLQATTVFNNNNITSNDNDDKN